MKRVTEKKYIRIYIKLAAVIALSVMIVSIPQQVKEDVQPPVKKQTVRAVEQPKAKEEIPEPVQEEVAIEAPIAQPASSGNSVEEIVRQAARNHGIDENYFVRIAVCESTLNPAAVNKNYYENGNPSGLFQHISGYWPARAEKYGYAGASVFDAVANANVTAAMFAEGHTNLWQCK